MAKEELRDSLERAFQAYGEPPETVILLKHMGQIMTAGNENWPAVVGNLRKALKIWMWTTRILGWKGTDPRISCLFLRRLFRQCYFSDVGPDPQYGSGPVQLLSQGPRRITGRQPRNREEGG